MCHKKNFQCLCEQTTSQTCIAWSFYSKVTPPSPQYCKPVWCLRAYQQHKHMQSPVPGFSEEQFGFAVLNSKPNASWWGTRLNYNVPAFIRHKVNTFSRHHSPRHQARKHPPKQELRYFPLRFRLGKTAKKNLRAQGLSVQIRGARHHKLSACDTHLRQIQAKFWEKGGHSNNSRDQRQAAKPKSLDRSHYDKSVPGARNHNAGVALPQACRHVVLCGCAWWAIYEGLERR